MSVRECHTHLKLATCSQPDCFLSALTILQTNDSLSKVTSLSMPWILSEPDWTSYLSFWSLLPNLSSLQLTPSLGPELLDAPYDSLFSWELIRPLPEVRALPSVRTLILDCAGDSPHNVRIMTVYLMVRLGPLLFQAVEAVTSLHLLGVDYYLANELVGICFGHLKKVDFLYLRNVPRKVLRVQWDLTWLEFDVCVRINDNSWSEVLAKFAPSLEHLTVAGVKNIAQGQKRESLLLPIFLFATRLKVLQIFRSPSKWKSEQLNQLACPHPEKRVPNLKLLTSEGAGINYELQFPVLRRLTVGPDEAEEDFWWETCVSFLFESFLPELLLEWDLAPR